MHQARVVEWGQAPRYVSATSLPPPTDEEVRIGVEYAGLHRIARSRASGSHYSAAPLPHVPGIDGVGPTEHGKLVYFFSLAVGSFSEEVNIPKQAVFELPSGLDPMLAAGMSNPAMSGRMAFQARTPVLKPGLSALILGATSASGRLATLFAKESGAGRVIGAARNKVAMDDMEHLDERIVVAGRPEDTTDFSSVGDVDVVIDHVYGPLTLHLLHSLTSSRPVDYVHIGALSGVLDISVPGVLLRSKDVAIRGSGPGAWAISSVVSELPAILEALRRVPKQPLRVAKLDDAESEWKTGTVERKIFAP